MGNKARKDSFQSFRIALELRFKRFLSSCFQSFVGMGCIFLFLVYTRGYLSFQLQSLRKSQKILVQRCSILVYCIFLWQTFAAPQHYKVWQSPKQWLLAGQQEIPTTIKKFIVFKNLFPGSRKTDLLNRQI